MDKFKIQKEKLQNEIKPYEVEETIVDPDTGKDINITTEHYDSSQMIGLALTDYSILEKELIIKIKTSLDKSFNTNKGNYITYEIEKDIEEAEKLIKYYSSFSDLIINEDMLIRKVMVNILEIMKSYQKDKFVEDNDKFAKDIISTIKEYEEWKKENWGTQEN
ncbi:hypothetical protein SAMN02745134_00352 [Clostridium acidisoli DSM 12555]|uniref:Uncharacterized protein n=1 Tax=Clostridium acidisoli DSM 12555 TaxID=1121291 RepID=A0A1W1X141_9CLOT|nr:hypothetical protein [Clostridium acidisoli]SMC17490.1 hypothetical protein SAMN02745134_00352 [Clostridium acidisoli DSM 12555]